MNDIRQEMMYSTMYNIRRTSFVIKTLGKGYYPEAILGISFAITLIVQKMEMMHRERVSHNLIIKPFRTWWQDPLIQVVASMATSSYVDVRMYLYL